MTNEELAYVLPLEAKILAMTPAIDAALARGEAGSSAFDQQREKVVTALMSVPDSLEKYKNL